MPGNPLYFNRLTKAKVYVADQLFATLDPTTCRVNLPGGHQVLLTDTVGFIQKLPTQLVAAFRATLEEIAEADLLIHVIDITHPSARAQSISVDQTLKEIEANDIPVIRALNKIDNLQDPEAARHSLDNFEDSVAISALAGLGIDDLVLAIETQLFETFIPIKIRLPYQQGQLISLFHEQGQVSFIEHGRGGVRMDGFIPGRLLTRFTPFLVREKKV